MTRRIGGPLNLEALEQLAGVDRPQQPPDRDTCRAAAIELRARGLTALDIAAALGLSEGAIRAPLGDAPQRGAGDGTESHSSRSQDGT